MARIVVVELWDRDCQIQSIMVPLDGQKLPQIVTLPDDRQAELSYNDKQVYYEVIQPRRSVRVSWA